MVLVLTSGSAVSIPWAQENLPAILAAWYPGEQGGAAVADVLFGDYNPAGRLPVTVPRSLDQLPPFADYAMAGRTYRFMPGEPLYRFGYGLSYTTFEYSNRRSLTRAGVTATRSCSSTSATSRRRFPCRSATWRASGGFTSPRARGRPSPSR